MRRSPGLFPVFAFAVAVLCGCDSGENRAREGVGAKPVEQVFRVNISEPKTLDPNLAWDIAEFKVLNHLFEPLVRLDANMQPLPGAAESWEHNDDYTVWTFHLREGLTWSNGDPVVAEDFVYSLRRILTPETKAQYAMMVYNFLRGGREFFDSDGADDANFGASAPDDRTLEIRLVSPAPFFPSLANHPSWHPLHRGAVESAGEDWWVEPGTFVGNGPFVLAENRPKERIVLARRPSYWDAANVKLERIVFTEIEDDASEIAAFEAGDIDMVISIPNREAEYWTKRPEFRRLPCLATTYLIFNTRVPPFDDVRARRAFSLAANRTLLCERVTRRGETPALGMVPPGMTLPGGEDYRDVAPRLIDSSDHKAAVAGAKRELAASKYPVPPRVGFMYSTEGINRDICEMLQTNWKADLGVEVDLDNQEWGQVVNRMRAGEFALTRLSWYGDYLDPMTFLENFESDTLQNYGGWRSDRYDELLAAARSESDPARRLEHYIAAERLLVAEEAAVAPLFHHVFATVVRPGFENIWLTPSGNMDASRGWRE